MEEARLTQDVTILASRTDDDGLLDEIGCMDIFMDSAVEHAKLMGIGFHALADKHQFWLTVKTRVHFYHRPALEDVVQVETWPQNVGKVRCLRDYRMSAGGEVLAEGKTEWAVFDTQTKKLVRMDEVYPWGSPVADEVLPGAFSHVNGEFTGEPFATYTFTSTDIDVGKHVNNVAYARALKSCFSTAGWHALHVTDIEVHYMNSCYEGQTMAFRERREGDVLVIEGSVEGKTCIYVVITSAAASDSGE